MSPSFVQTRQFVHLAVCKGSYSQSVSLNITIITFLLFKDPKLKRKQSSWEEKFTYSYWNCQVGFNGVLMPSYTAVLLQE